MFSISSSEIPKVPSMGNWQREGERESKKRRRREKTEKALDEEDGKFGECGPYI